MRIGLPWLWPILVCGSSLPAAGSGVPEERREVTLLVTAGLSGKLVDETGDELTTVAALVQTVRLEAEAARRAGREVLVIDAGRTLVPYAESRDDG